MNTIFLLFFAIFAQTKSHADLTKFLLSDQTNTIPYSSTFNCVQFSKTLIKNANGFDAIPVQVGWSSSEGFAFHEFVAFNTSNGIIWVEPQNDQEYKIVDAGQPLCHVSGDCVTPALAFVRYDGKFQASEK